MVSPPIFAEADTLSTCLQPDILDPSFQTRLISRQSLNFIIQIFKLFVKFWGINFRGLPLETDPFLLPAARAQATSWRARRSRTLKVASRFATIRADLSGLPRRGWRCSSSLWSSFGFHWKSICATIPCTLRGKSQLNYRKF